MYIGVISNNRHHARLHRVESLHRSNGCEAPCHSLMMILPTIAGETVRVLCQGSYHMPFRHAVMLRRIYSTHLQLVDQLESTHTSLPHDLHSIEDTLETRASDLHGVHGQLLLSEKTLSNTEALLRELVVRRGGREVHAELVERLAKGGVCKHHLLWLVNFSGDRAESMCEVHTMFSTSWRLCLVCRR
jgi:hypothetical protein